MKLVLGEDFSEKAVNSLFDQKSSFCCQKGEKVPKSAKKAKNGGSVRFLGKDGFCWLILNSGSGLLEKVNSFRSHRFALFVEF